MSIRIKEDTPAKTVLDQISQISTKEKEPHIGSLIHGIEFSLRNEFTLEEYSLIDKILNSFSDSIEQTSSIYPNDKLETQHTFKLFVFKKEQPIEKLY